MVGDGDPLLHHHNPQKKITSHPVGQLTKTLQDFHDQTNKLPHSKAQIKEREIKADIRPNLQLQKGQNNTVPRKMRQLSNGMHELFS